jgi:GrpB-like predicted nucleotidyltransferase (UPF0157 family)
VADASVFIAQYEPAWLAGFVGERDRVTAVLKPWLAAPVEHIGSTSVPGLPAKPIVDMLALVKSLSQAQNAVAPLRADGWVFGPLGHQHQQRGSPHHLVRDHGLTSPTGDPGAFPAPLFSVSSPPGLSRASGPVVSG